ncbi:hypothetical protein CBF23_006040 [Marinomonas agarivorans]|nr:hypothetical protein CBF23_006040 [Marinomonas agarivorans]
MGIVKISDPLHEEVRKSSNVMSRSMNAQAEFWLKMGMLAERNPQLTFHQIIERELAKENGVVSHTVDSTVNTASNALKLLQEEA